MVTRDGKPVRVALAGQPNVGESTVFNLLTGLNQHVDNWPGKTVEQKTGTCDYDGIFFELVVLPGTYILSAHSPEELIARGCIIKEEPDVVIWSPCTHDAANTATPAARPTTVASAAAAGCGC